MAYLIKLPPLGEGIFEAQMIMVHKNVGDEVKEGDIIAEMETDKAVGALASPVDGVIKEFYIEQYDYVFRDEKVLLIDDGKEEVTTGAGADGGRVTEDGEIVPPPEDEKLGGVSETPPPPAKKEPSPKPAAPSEKEEPAVEKSETEKAPEEPAGEEEAASEAAVTEEGDNGFKKVTENGQEYYVVDSSGSTTEIFKRFYGEADEPKPADKPDMEFMAEQGQAQQGEPKPTVSKVDRYLEPLTSNFMHSLDGSQPIPTHIANEIPYEELLERGKGVKAVPAVREYAAKNSIDISQLPPDEDGIVTKEIVDLAISHAVGEREWNYRLIDEHDPGYFTNRPEDEQGREETYIRKYNASRFEMTHHKVPPFSVQVKVDMSKLQTYIDIRKGDRAGKHAYIPYFIKAICIAAYRYPELNASIDDVVSVFRFKSYVNVGIEMNTVQGLFTPVVKDANDMSIDEIGKRVDELEHEVKVERIFNYETNSESTITITDLSELGPIESFVPIIHYPNAAIFGLANTRDEAVVVDGEIEILPMKPMTLVIDSRIVTRDKAVRISNFIKDMMEKPSFLFQMEEELAEIEEENE